ncbi:FMN reductase [Aestuariimicrobium ganziense]|uniref:FMN reductase n=1 Tax=Aestuariimicrobium ganziense TaxID=2773677 RepID=UPI001943FA93|nr:FMN reductase [Aestuariimicrobium ganziense]
MTQDQNPQTPRHRIVVLNGGMRVPSTTRMLADRLADATVAAVAEQGGEASVQVIDLRTHAHALADTMLTGFSSGELAEDLAAVAGADGLIAVSPTFSASYSGMFKTFVDVIEPGTLNGKPVLVGATGGSERHSLMLDHALRPLFSYLGADPVRTGVFAATADFGSGEGGAITERIARAGSELASRLAGRPSQARRPADAFGEQSVPVEEMLARVTRPAG